MLPSEEYVYYITQFVTVLVIVPNDNITVSAVAYEIGQDDLVRLIAHERDVLGYRALCAHGHHTHYPLVIRSRYVILHSQT